MFKFGKKKRYTIGEKIQYFNSILKNNSETIKRKNWATLRLSNLQQIKDKMKIGDVFVINDNHLGNPKKKPRLVVIAKQNSDNDVKILPVRKDNKLMSLSNFDEQRALTMNNAFDVPKNQLYEKRGFKIVKNAYLTPKEKNRLFQKVSKYL